MMHLAHKVTGVPVTGTDGEIGTLEDFYFQENPWTVRYLVVDAGGWFNGKRLLIPPMAVRGEWGTGGLRVDLRREQAWNSPVFDRTRPLTRSKEAMVLDYYGYPHYWGDTALWAIHEPPPAPAGPGNPSPGAGEPQDARERDVEAHDLRSVNRSTGYHLRATNGEVGHVDDFLIRQETFAIPYLLVDTSNWIGGRSVVVSSDLLQRVDRDEELLYVDASRDTIRQSPALRSIEAAIPTLETGAPFTII